MKIEELNVGDEFYWKEIDNINYDIDDGRCVVFFDEDANLCIECVIINAFNKDKEYQKNPKLKVNNIYRKINK